MPELAYLSRPPSGADLNRLLTELDRRLGIALNGHSPLAPCQRGLTLGGSAALSPLWGDMFSRTHSLLGYRFSFTAGDATPYHDLAAGQVGAWPDYDHAALTAIAAAATVTAQDDDLGTVTFASDPDTVKLEGSLEALTREIEEGDFTGEFYFVNVNGRPHRYHEYAVAELVVEGLTEITVPREWNRFGCLRIHNLGTAELSVTVERFDAELPDDTFTVKPWGVQAVRRSVSGHYDRSLTYFWKWRVERERPIFLEAGATPYAGYSVPECSARANPLARFTAPLDWLAHFNAELDPRVLPDQSARLGMFARPATADVFGDIIHYRGLVWSIAYPEDLSEPPVITKGSFTGYANLVGDFAALGIEVTETDGVYTLERADGALGDVAKGLDVYAPGSNLLHGPTFHSFRTLPFTLESTALLRWSHPVFTAVAADETLTVKTLTDADPETYDSGQTATVPRLRALPLRWAVTARARASGTGTLTLDADHNLTVGQVVWVYGVHSEWDGVVTLTGVTTDTISYAVSGGATSASCAGFVQGEPTQRPLSADPAPPTLDGVTWTGTWRLTPSGWRAAWTHEIELTGPGLLSAGENGSLDQLLDRLYDDVDETGLATVRGQAAVVRQGWPLDYAEDPFAAGTGNPHALLPNHDRRYREQALSGPLGYHDPGFTGYLGLYGGGDLQPADRTSTAYPGLRSLQPLAFRQNPTTAAAGSHRLAAIGDLAHFPMLFETTPCDDAGGSLWSYRASIAAEDTGGGLTDVWHYLPVLPDRFNLLAWHINAWTRTPPLCTVMDLLLGSYYDEFTFSDVFFTMGMFTGDYFNGVVRPSGGGSKSPTWWLCNLSGDLAPLWSALDDLGITVSTEADYPGAAAVAAALAASPLTAAWELTATPTTDGEITVTSADYSYSSVGGPFIYTYSNVVAVCRHTMPFRLSFGAADTPADADLTGPETDYATAIDGFLNAEVHWLSAQTVKAWAAARDLVFVFEAEGLPLQLQAVAAETPEYVIEDTVYATHTETTVYPTPSCYITFGGSFTGDFAAMVAHFSIPTLPTPNAALPANGTNANGASYVWAGDATVDTSPQPAGVHGNTVVGKFLRWVPVATDGDTDWLGGGFGQLPPLAITGQDDLWKGFSTTTGKGGPGLASWLSGTGRTYLLNLGDNPPGGRIMAQFYLPSVPIGPGGGGALAITDGRPAAVRAVDRGLYQTWAVACAVNDPTGQLVSGSRLFAHKAFDLAFDSAWLTASVEHLALGHHAIPRTLTAGGGDPLSVAVAPNAITVIAPPEGQTGAWEVEFRSAHHLDLA